MVTGVNPTIIISARILWSVEGACITDPKVGQIRRSLYKKSRFFSKKSLQKIGKRQKIHFPILDEKKCPFFGPFFRVFSPFFAIFCDDKMHFVQWTVAVDTSFAHKCRIIIFASFLKKLAKTCK